MDLRVVVDDILRKYGHNAYLQRRIHEDRPKDQSFSSVLEKHTVRDRLGSSSGSLTSVLQEDMEGLNFNVDVVFYFRWSANPDRGDRIYDPGPHGFTTYICDWTYPMRGANGRVEYWVAGTTIEERADND